MLRHYEPEVIPSGKVWGNEDLPKVAIKCSVREPLSISTPKCTSVLNLVAILPGRFFVSVEKSHVGFSLAAILTQIYNNRKSTQLCVVPGASRISRWCKISQSILYEPHSDLHAGRYHPIEGVSG